MTVHPLEPRKLGPQAQVLMERMRFAGDVKPHLDRNYLVKGWLDRGGLSVMYGPSNVGKSFLALDMAHHVSKGRQWGKRRVKKGRVLYVAAEGGVSFGNRVAALDEPEMWILDGAMCLTGPRSQARFLAEVVDVVARTGGAPFDLIIFDTMSRVMGAGDENTSTGIADLMNSVDHIREFTGAHVMLVHHTGKEGSRGARGHSSLRAAIDTEIELTRDEEIGVISAEVTKQRDGPTGYKLSYTLRLVELGKDQDGDAVTTCVVEAVA